MNMPDNIKPKDDALRQVMRRRKERRPSMELPKEVEDRVMERICAPDKVKSEERRVKSEERRVKSEERRVKNQNVFLLAQLYDSSLFTLRSSLSILRPLSAAAAIACILVLAETMIPESQIDVEPALVAKIEVYRPLKPVAEPERPAVVAADEPAVTQRKRHSPKVRKTAVRQVTDVTDAEVCINCELDAMADELTAMINEFENQ